MTRIRAGAGVLWILTFGVLAVTSQVVLHAQSATEPPGSAERQASTQDAPPGQPQPTTRPAQGDGAGADTRSKPPTVGDPEPAREPTATEILRALTRRATAPARPIVRPSTPGQIELGQVSGEAVSPNAIRPPQRRLLPDGYRLVDRPGRLVREGKGWVFSFESRSRGAPELPISLLPNRLLEDMEMFSAGGTKPVVFLVSGELTEYHGANYLLVQKVLTRPDLGNLE